MGQVRGNNLGYVAVLRHLQYLHEPAGRRNPDHLVGRLFPWKERLRHRLISRRELEAYRSQPFYYFLVARTLHYDEWFLGVLNAGLRHVVNIGCGSDTRSHRFRPQIEACGSRVFECDLPVAISDKEAAVVARLGHLPYVSYVPIDLNDEAWPAFEEALNRIGGAPTAVMIEGVSAYVNKRTFERFLQLLAGNLAPGSMLAYDYKIAGVADQFARTERVPCPFRLPLDADEVKRFHEELGLHVERLEAGWNLETRLLPDVAAQEDLLFRQDVLLSLTVSSAD